jgi:DNA-directed RNA polymerase specialized sigma24 family protein
VSNSSENGSVTEWIGDLNTADRDEASRRLWERYFQRLAQFAQGRLRACACGAADGEDIALNVLDSFFRGIASGRFRQLGSRDELWRLLVTIAARKAQNQRREQFRKKRGGGRVVGEAALAGVHSSGRDALDEIPGNEPTPEFAAMVTDEYRRLFGGLTNESLRVVAILKLEGHSNDEIAKSLDCSLRSVERKLEMIRKRWLPEGAV